MSAEPVVVNVDEKIASLEQQAQEIQRKLAMYRELRADAGGDANGTNGASSTPPKPRMVPMKILPHRSSGGNPAYEPKGSISGVQGAIQYLQKVGKDSKERSMTDVHRGAIALGADVSYGAIHQMIVELAEKGRYFTRDRKRKLIGLIEWAEHN